MTPDTARRSRASAGEIADCDDPLTVLVTDEDDEPVGILSRWGDDEWLYAPFDDVEQSEPAREPDDRPLGDTSPPDGRSQLPESEIDSEDLPDL